MPLRLHLRFLLRLDAGVDLIQGLSGIDEEVHHDELVGHITVAALVIHAYPAVSVLVQDFHDFPLGEQAVDLCLQVGLHPHPERLRVDGGHHLAHVVGHGQGLLAEQQVFIRGPSDDVARLQLRPSVPTLQDRASAILVQHPHLVSALAGIAPYVQSVLHIGHDQFGLLRLILVRRQVQVQLLGRGDHDIRRVGRARVEHCRHAAAGLIHIIVPIGPGNQVHLQHHA